MSNAPQHAALSAEEIALGFDLAGVGLCISRERVIQRCNQEFGSMFGYAPEELAGRSLAMLYPSRMEFQDIGSRGLTIMQHTGRYSDDRVMLRKNGELFWCHVVGRTTDLNNPFSLAVWAFEDISAKRPVSVDLSPREREVTQLLIIGKTSKEIAKDLALSVRTVDAYRAKVISKFKVKSVIELISKVVGVR